MATNKPLAPVDAERRIDSRFRFDALTSMRGIAALFTLLVHLVTVWAVVFPALPTWKSFYRFAEHSYLFVDFFFILSGFVMSHVYGSAFREKVTFSAYTKFMRARFARIYPLHLLLLAIYVALAYAGVKQERENAEWSMLAHVFLLHAMGFFDYTTWNVPSWSISVEWWTYVIFPFVAAFVQRRLRAATAVPALAACGCLFILLTAHYGSASLTVGVAYIRCLIGFTAGACLYTIFTMRREKRSAGMINAALLVAIIAGLAWLPSPAADIFAFFGFCALVYVSSTDTNQRDWLHHRTLVWLGDISYSIYLWHTLLLHVFAKAMLKLKGGHVWTDGEQVAYFIVALVAFELFIVGFAYLSYTFIELPARNFINGKRRVYNGTISEGVMAAAPTDAR